MKPDFEQIKTQYKKSIGFDFEVKNREIKYVTARQAFVNFIAIHYNFTWGKVAKLCGLHHSTCIHSVNKHHEFINSFDRRGQRYREYYSTLLTLYYDKPVDCIPERAAITIVQKQDQEDDTQEVLRLRKEIERLENDLDDAIKKIDKLNTQIERMGPKKPHKHQEMHKLIYKDKFQSKNGVRHF